MKTLYDLDEQILMWNDACNNLGRFAFLARHRINRHIADLKYTRDQVFDIAWSY